MSAPESDVSAIHIANGAATTQSPLDHDVTSSTVLNANPSEGLTSDILDVGQPPAEIPPLQRWRSHSLSEIEHLAEAGNTVEDDREEWSEFDKYGLDIDLFVGSSRLPPTSVVLCGTQNADFDRFRRQPDEAHMSENVAGTTGKGSQLDGTSERLAETSAGGLGEGSMESPSTSRDFVSGQCLQMSHTLPTSD